MKRKLLSLLLVVTMVASLTMMPGFGLAESNSSGAKNVMFVSIVTGGVAWGAAQKGAPIWSTISARWFPNAAKARARISSARSAVRRMTPATI